MEFDQDTHQVRVDMVGLEAVIDTGVEKVIQFRSGTGIISADTHTILS